MVTWCLRGDNEFLLLPGLLVVVLPVFSACSLGIVDGVVVLCTGSVSIRTVGGGLTNLQADEIKFALLTSSGARPPVPKHSNGPRVKKESLASELNCNIFTGNDDLSCK